MTNKRYNTGHTKLSSYYEDPKIIYGKKLCEVTSSGLSLDEIIKLITRKKRHVKDEALEFIMNSNFKPTKGVIYTSEKYFDASNIRTEEVIQISKSSFDLTINDKNCAIEASLLFREKFSQEELSDNNNYVFCTKKDTLIFKGKPVWFVLGKDRSGEWLDIFDIKSGQIW